MTAEEAKSRLKVLDIRCGVGKGSSKERKKLQAVIDQDAFYASGYGVHAFLPYDAVYPGVTHRKGENTGTENLTLYELKTVYVRDTIGLCMEGEERGE